MDHVGGIEELGNREVRIILGRVFAFLSAIGAVLVVEHEIFSNRAIVVLPVVLTFPVLLSKDLKDNEA